MCNNQVSSRKRMCSEDWCSPRLIVWSVAILLTTMGLIDHRIVAVSGHKQDLSNHVACFYGSWAVYRPGRGKLDIEDIDPFLCTHLIYSFAGITEDGLIKSLDPYNDLYEDYGKGGYHRFNQLRTYNANLTTMLAIGGWDEGSEKYSRMASTAEGRRAFIVSVIECCQRHLFNGIVVDWEYPTFRGGIPDDRRNFAYLIQEMSEAMEPYKLTLSAAVSAGKEKIDKGYDVDSLVNYLDIFYIMTFDFHGSWEHVTGHHSPLFGNQNDIMDNPTLNTNFSVNYWLNAGVPREKLALTISFYGRTFTLADSDQYWAYSPSIGPGKPGPYTRMEGHLSYQEICEYSAKKPWPAYRDPDYYGLIAAQGDQWVGYDDLYSVRSKVQYARSLQLGGIAVWALDMDDVKFPLLKAISDELGRDYRSHETATRSAGYQSSAEQTSPHRNSDVDTFSVVTAHPNETHAALATTLEAGVDTSCQNYCNADGFRRIESDCRKFYRCVGTDGQCHFYEFECPDQLVFDYTKNECDWKDNVPECSNFV